MNTNFKPLTESYKRKIGNVTYIVSSFCNADTAVTADELLLNVISAKAENENRIERSNDK